MNSTTINTNLSDLDTESMLNVLSGFNRNSLRELCRKTGTTQGKTKLDMVANLGRNIKTTKPKVDLQLTF